MSEAETYLSLWKGEIPRPDGDPRPEGGMKSIREQVEREYGLEPRSLFSPNRSRSISWPRHDFMWRCRQVKWPDGRHRYSQPQIAYFLGLENHTSVIHGERAHAKRRAEAAEKARGA